MIRQRHKTTSVVYLTGDIVAAVGAFFGAWYLRFGSGLFPAVDQPEFSRYLILLPFIVVLWPIWTSGFAPTTTVAIRARRPT